MKLKNQRKERSKKHNFRVIMKSLSLKSISPNQIKYAKTTNSTKK